MSHMKPRGVVKVNQRHDRGYIAAARETIFMADVISHRGPCILTKTGRGLLLGGLKPDIQEAFRRRDPGVIEELLQQETDGENSLVTLPEGVWAELFSGEFDVRGEPLDHNRIKGAAFKIVQLAVPVSEAI